MIKVSIIVPVHNGEKYLSRCLDSLMKQTLNEIEIIIIDDGSTDSTWNIIAEYQDRYCDRIRGHKNQGNIGTGSTRNVGLSLAQGDYIIFADSDDWVSPDYCERLWEKAVEEKADVVYCTAHQVNADGQVIFEMIPPYREMDLKDPVNKRKALVAGLHNTIAYWNQLVRRDIYTSTGYQAMEGAVFNEDYMLACIPFLCEKIAAVYEPLYFQEKRSDSVFYSEKRKFPQRVKAAECVLEMARKLDIFNGSEAEWEYMYILMIFLNSVPEFKNRKLYNVFPIEHMKTAQRMIKAHFPEYIHNKYLLISPFQEGVQYLRAFSRGMDNFYKFYYGCNAYLNIAYSKKITELIGKYAGQRIAIWGAGLKGQAFLLKDHQGVNENIRWIIDKNEKIQGEEICGIPVVLPERVCHDVEIVMVMNHALFLDIQREISDWGLSNQIAVIDFEEYLLYT